jgi:hypothetical protein
VLDDLHWADRPSLLLLRHLVRRSTPSSVLVLGTYRDTEVSRTHALADVLADLRRERLFSRILVRGMSDDDVHAMLDSRAASRREPERSEESSALAAGLRSAADGNPFFIDELVRHLTESGALHERDGRWEVAEMWDDLGVPEGVREVIGRRLSRLSDSCNQVLAAGAVLGREMPFDLVRRMVDLGDDVVVAAVEEAVRARLLVEDDSSGPLVYAFNHALVREALYDELSLPRRQRLHLRAAQAIEAAFEPTALGDWAGALAAHYLLAGAAADEDRAVEWSTRAAIAAYGVFAYEEAAAHWGAAVALLRERGGRERDLQRARILERLGALAYFTGSTTEGGVAPQQEALEVYERYGIADRAARVHSRLGAHFASLGVLSGLDVPRARQHFAAAAPLLEHDKGVAGGFFHVGSANAAMRALELDEARAAATRVLDVADRLEDRVLWVNAVVLDGVARWERGDVLAGGRELERAWAVADELDHPLLALLSAWNRGDQLLEADAPQAAASWYEREVEAPRLAHARGARAGLRTSLARARFAEGRLDAARRLAAEGPPHRLLLDEDWERTVVEQRAEYDVRLSTGDVWGALWLAPAYAQQARVSGDLVTAGAVLDEAIATATTHNAVVAGVALRAERAIVRWAAGGHDDVARDARWCREVLGDAGSTAVGHWRGLAGRVLLAESLAAGNIAIAARHLHAARAVFAANCVPWLEAEAGVLAARLLRAAGDAEAARQWTVVARTVYERIGAPSRWLARLDTEATA